MPDPSVSRERATNLWSSFERKFPPIAKASQMDAQPDVGVEQIGGLAAAKEEVLTYACAATDPEVYARWGTLPPTTCFFDELEFSQAEAIGSHRPDLPVGPIMDFLLDLLERTIAIPHALVLGATSHPDTLRPAFLAPRRFERVVEVNPIVPDDVVAALVLHKEGAEKRAGRPLFAAIDWERVVGSYAGPSTGEWVRVLHAVLRRKARCEAANETTGPVTTEDLLREVDRLRQTRGRLPIQGGGIYL